MKKNWESNISGFKESLLFDLNFVESGGFSFVSIRVGIFDIGNMLTDEVCRVNTQ